MKCTHVTHRNETQQELCWDLSLTNFNIVQDLNNAHFKDTLRRLPTSASHLKMSLHVLLWNQCFTCARESVSEGELETASCCLPPLGSRCLRVAAVLCCSPLLSCLSFSPPFSCLALCLFFFLTHILHVRFLLPADASAVHTPATASRQMVVASTATLSAGRSEKTHRSFLIWSEHTADWVGSGKHRGRQGTEEKPDRGQDLISVSLPSCTLHAIGQWGWRCPVSVRLSVRLAIYKCSGNQTMPSESSTREEALSLNVMHAFRHCLAALGDEWLLQNTRYLAPHDFWPKSTIGCA